MDKVLKQRLIGASILIALAVIFVPMFFDAPDRDGLTRDLALDLPEAPEQRPPVRRMALDPDQARRPTAPPAAESDRSAEPQEPSRAPEPDPWVASAPAEPLDEVIDLLPPPETVDEPPSPAVAAADPPRPMVAGPMEETTDAAPAQTPAPVAAPSGQGGWMVQVASFGAESTAAEIIERLNRLGHAASSELLVRGDTRLHRVRTGPYASRDAADQARGQIARTVTGVEPVVVAVTASAVPAQAAAEGEGFVVQVGSFASRNNAVRLQSQLEGDGFETLIHEDQAGSRTIWRVRVGPIGDRARAEQTLRELADRSGVEGLVVSHP